MIRFQIHIEGTAPLLMHSSRLADPLNPATKALKKITGKRKKTDEDHEEIARLEHAAGLYLDPDVGPFIPGENIARCLVDAAKVSRQGVAVTRGVLITTDVNPIAYSGPRDAESLWKDENFRLVSSAKVGTQRVMRCRPMFRQWRTTAEGLLDPNILDLGDLAAIAETAGAMIGVGDWRPRYGRFVSNLDQVAA